jgi:hypothetical protein
MADQKVVVMVRACREQLDYLAVERDASMRT